MLVTIFYTPRGNQMLEPQVGVVKVKRIISGVAAFGIALVVAAESTALEGGVETYLLGSRDSMAGVMPPPGTYLNNDLATFSGSGPTLSLGGAVVTDPKIDITVYKFNLTHILDASWGNARLGINVNLPYVWADGSYTGELSSGFGGTLTDSGERAWGDIVVSPMFGWTQGKLSTMLALQFFLPTGHYHTAQINVPARSIDALNASKNRFAFDPVLSMTWFDPASGWEVSGALGVTISAKNTATDYQTAPEAHFEGTVMRHLPNKLALGLTGYAYHQIGEDSGAGADNLKAATGARSLTAEVYGLGPIVTWSTMVGNTPMTVKAKYIQEFGARRRFESDKLWVTVGFVF